jgi:hypothetical protein
MWRRHTRKVGLLYKGVRSEGKKKKQRGMKASGDRKMRNAKCEKRDWIPSDVMLFYYLCYPSYLQRPPFFFLFSVLFSKQMPSVYEKKAFGS